MNNPCSEPSDDDEYLYTHHQIISSSSNNYNNYYFLLPSTEDENQILLHDNPHPPVMDFGKGKKLQQRKVVELPSIIEEEEVKEEDESNKMKKKKWLHREIEKQRRQEMATLCTTFRSLLPLQYIKGKRSISDHMHEGTNYIKHLQHKVKHLKDKRDDLINKLSNNHDHDLPNVIVDPCSSSSSSGEGVIEIKCSYNFKKYCFPLSTLLHILLQQGFHVLNCTSTKTDHTFIHIILSEDPHMKSRSSGDYTELQRKLMRAIISSSSSLEETV